MGYVDTIAAHVPGAGTLFNQIVQFLLSPPDWLTLALAFAAFGLIAWDLSRKRRPVHVHHMELQAETSPKASLAIEVHRQVRCDVKLGEALAYAATGQWGRTPMADDDSGGSVGQVSDKLQEFLQLARDGTLAAHEAFAEQARLAPSPRILRGRILHQPARTKSRENESAFCARRTCRPAIKAEAVLWPTSESLLYRAAGLRRPSSQSQPYASAWL